MDLESRRILRHVGESDSIVGPAPIEWGRDGSSGVLIQVENRYTPLRNLHGELISLFVSDQGCRVRYFARLSGVDQPLEWSVSPLHSLVRREVRRVERLGLWELSDFMPHLEDCMGDGVYWIVRATDFDRKISSDACLCYPDSSVVPHIRRLGRCLQRLIGLKENYFAQKQSRWGRLFN